jgi:hypothetical protein
VEEEDFEVAVELTDVMCVDATLLSGVVVVGSVLAIAVAILEEGLLGPFERFSRWSRAADDLYRLLAQGLLCT